MTKKSLDIKAAIKLIESKLEENKSKKEILDELSETYFDRDLIAKLIAATPDKATKEKYKILNNLLLYILVFTIIYKVLIGVLLLKSVSIYAIPLALLFPLINVFFAIEVAKFKGYIYNILVLISIASIFKSLSDISLTEIWGIIDLSIVLAITALAFYLGKKMFPNYGLFGPKKGKNGELMLS